MSQFVINNLLYDTEKMEFVCTVRKWYKSQIASEVFRKDVGTTYECKLYVSKKGNFLLVRESDCNTLLGEAITKEEAKRLLQRSNLIKYQELFGELEEA